MVFWIALAVLAAAASMPLLIALGRAPTAASSASAQAMAIYRDQLDEIGRDSARGILAAGEAEAARTEIARRLIREGAVSPATAADSGRRRTIAAAIVIGMPVAALALYLVIGSPLSPDQPVASRPDALALQDVTKLVTAVEAHLAVDPNDGKGWEVLAPVYGRLGRDADAVHAWSQAIALLGSTTERQTNLGEAIVQLNAGTVTPDAEAAFTAARTLAPADPKPRFYLALALGQQGKIEEAKAAWRALLQDAPKDATWVPAAEMQLAALEAPSPGSDEIKAAASLQPEQRQQMIEGMVAQLAARLKTEPGDAEGWARLVRSYTVLGRKDDAVAALAAARAALAGDTARLAIVDAAARELGLVEATQ